MLNRNYQSLDGQQGPNDHKSANILIVGGGPLGLAHAWGFKKLNPHLTVIVLEKYKEYQRSHTLIMQHQWLAALMNATNTQKDPVLSKLLAQLKNDPHIRTNELESIFKTLATDNGVEIKIEEVNQENIREKLYQYNPDLIIGADGTHSTVNNCLFPENNQVKIEFDYVLQLRYEIQGNKKAEKISGIGFYDNMARRGLIANEYIGKYDEEKKTTPVTMQMMISREAFLRLKKATSKNPLKPYADMKGDNDSKNEANSVSDCKLRDIPDDIRGFVNDYLMHKVKFSGEDTIDSHSVRISVNEAPAVYAKQPVYMHHDVPMTLVGDAGLALSYFKGLNAGIEAAAKFFTLLSHVIKNNQLVNKEIVQKNLDKYAEWFLNDFAPKKLKEVESYSTWQIRSVMRVMETVNASSRFSMGEYFVGDDDILKNYFTLMASNPPSGNFLKKNLYPHRAYDPIKPGQLAYVPIMHTLTKMGKLFHDYIKPYKSGYQLRQDFKQPLVGAINLLRGIAKMLGGIFTLNIKLFGDGVLTAIRGSLEIATTPLAWIVKPLTRGIATLITNHPKVENNSGMKRVAKQGLSLVQQITSESSDSLKPEEKYRLFAISNDLHRKFHKSLSRRQHSNIGLEEQRVFAKLQSNAATATEAMNSENLIQYFSLFAESKRQTASSLDASHQPGVTAVSRI